MSASDIARVLPFGGDETELVTALQAGSNEAFDSLVTHYHAPVYNLVYRILGTSPDAADVTQEVFLKAFRGIGAFRRGSSVRTWLYRIAVHEALNYRRWWWRHQRNQISIDSAVPGDAPALDLESIGASPFEAFAAQEVQALVRRALTHVPKCFRSAVILRDLEGLSYEEVAEVLEVSIGTVKSRILRGRQALREILTPLLDGRGVAAARTPQSQDSAARPSNAGASLPALAGRIEPSLRAGVSLGVVAEGGRE